MLVLEVPGVLAGRSRRVRSAQRRPSGPPRALERVMAAAAVVVAVGREVDGVPVGLDRWRDIREATAWTVQGQPSGTVFTRDALGHGQWDGRSEESVTVAGEVEPFGVPGVLEVAEALRVSHQQDAVAVTVGVTVLVGQDDGPPLSERLRVLAAALEHVGL